MLGMEVRTWAGKIIATLKPEDLPAFVAKYGEPGYEARAVEGYFEGNDNEWRWTPPGGDECEARVNAVRGVATEDQVVIEEGDPASVPALANLPPRAQSYQRTTCLTVFVSVVNPEQPMTCPPFLSVRFAPDLAGGFAVTVIFADPAALSAAFERASQSIAPAEFETKL